MSAKYSDYKRQLAYNSGTLTFYFGIGQGQYNCFQVTKESTGTLDSIRLEVSNYTQGAQAKSLDASTENWAWSDVRLTGTFGSNGSASPPPTYLTASAAPASVLFDPGVLNARWARVILNVGFGDYFRIAWHAKGS